MTVRRPLVRIGGRNKELPLNDTLPGIDTLADVTITTPVAGQVIKRNAANTGWENAAAPTGGGGAGRELVVADGISPPSVVTNEAATDFLYQDLP